MEDLTTFNAALEDNSIKINIKVMPTPINFKNGDVHKEFTLMDGSKCCLHKNSIPAFKASVTPEGTLPSPWHISKSGMLTNFVKSGSSSYKDY